MSNDEYITITFITSFDNFERDISCKTSSTLSAVLKDFFEINSIQNYILTSCTLTNSSDILDQSKTIKALNIQNTSKITLNMFKNERPLALGGTFNIQDHDNTLIDKSSQLHSKEHLNCNGENVLPKINSCSSSAERANRSEVTGLNVQEIKGKKVEICSEIDKSKEINNNDNTRDSNINFEEIKEDFCHVTLISPPFVCCGCEKKYVYGSCWVVAGWTLLYVMLWILFLPLASFVLLIYLAMIFVDKVTQSERERGKDIGDVNNSNT